MRICFYDWALHIRGGGQKFDCKIAEHLSQEHEVDILTLFPVSKEEIEKAYSVNLSKIGFKNLYKKRSLNPSLAHLLSFTRVSEISAKYDLFFNADAHETVKPLAKYNVMYCHFFEPRWYKRPKNFSDFLKVLFVYIFKTFLRNYVSEYDAVYCNSNYTKKWLKKLWNVDSEVIYPPVDIPKNKSYRKYNIILSTGRLTKDKNYEFVIDCFKKIYDSDKDAKKYKCIICGIKSDSEYYSKLKELARGYPITIITDLSSEDLKKIYEKSKIFIQAKGFGIDENDYPNLMEHFGMAVSEAMSYGCVPIVLNKAGYRETVKNEKSGFLFDDEGEAIGRLRTLIKNQKLWQRLSRNAREMARKFSLERMQKEIDEAIAKALKSGKL